MGDVGSAAITSSITEGTDGESERSAPAFGDTTDEHEREREGESAEHGEGEEEAERAASQSRPLGVRTHCASPTGG